MKLMIVIVSIGSCIIMNFNHIRFLQQNEWDPVIQLFWPSRLNVPFLGVNELLTDIINPNKLIIDIPNDYIRVRAKLDDFIYNTVYNPSSLTCPKRVSSIVFTNYFSTWPSGKSISYILVPSISLLFRSPTTLLKWSIFLPLTFFNTGIQSQPCTTIWVPIQLGF